MSDLLMDLWKLTVSTTSEAADAVEALLLEHGALGTEVVDARDFESVRTRGLGEWIDPSILALPPEGALVSAYTAMASGETKPSALWLEQVDECLAAVRGSGLTAGTLQVTIEAVPAASYEDAWKTHYHAISISSRMIVVPMWEREQVLIEDGQIAIYMDPGMAFGTGTHETTTLCLRVATDLVVPAKTRLLDVGTGSGILAIAAMKLGAKEVLAVDLDPQAVQIAQANAKENGLSTELATGQLRIAASDLLQAVPAGERFELIMANLLADLVIKVAPAIPGILAQGGCFVASGIVKHQAQDVRAALLSAGFSRTSQETLGDWVVLLAYCD